MKLRGWIQWLVYGVVAAGALAVALGLYSLGHAETGTQRTGIRRTELQRHDLSVPAREVVQARVELDPGATSGKHWHPGEEIVYVLEGSLEYQVEGKSAVILKPGGVLFIPANTVHAARNVGSGPGVELATYVVEKGKPLVVFTK